MLLVCLSATVILYAVTLTHLETKQGEKNCFQPLDNDDKYSYFNETNQACKIHSHWVKSLNIYHSKPACTPESICVFTLFTLGPKVTAMKLMGNQCARTSSCMSNLPSIRSNSFFISFMNRWTDAVEWRTFNTLIQRLSRLALASARFLVSGKHLSPPAPAHSLGSWREQRPAK